MLQKKLSQRYFDLAGEIEKIFFSNSSDGLGSYSKDGAWRKWATSAQNLIELTFGVQSPHSRNFRSLYDACLGSEYEVRPLFEVFQSAWSDFRGGFAGNIDLRISGEVFGDFVALAKQSLSEGHKDVAAVLACAALEDALKRFAAANNLNSDQKDMTEVINSLKGAGLVSGAQKSLLDVMPRIRNFALHAEWGKITEPDVNSVIGFVEQFLLTKFE
jgi:Domain of unknown function (DUF4145)